MARSARPAPDAAAVPVRGRLFEDTMDGYFPFRESVRQLLERHGFGAAWLSIAHAPMMDLPGLPPGAPVPLRLPDGAAGTIRWMAAVAVLDPCGLRLRGAARWSWFGLHRPEARRFCPDWRLAEPVYLRGIGLARGPDDGSGLRTAGFGTLAPAAGMDGSILYRPEAAPAPPDSRLWGVDAADAILPEADLPRPGLFGAPAGAAGAAGAAECLAVIAADAGAAALARQMAADR